MKNFRSILFSVIVIFSAGVFAQEEENTDEEVTQKGHFNENKFRQLYDLFSTPNQYRTGSGAPGEAYYQNQADYKMDIEIDDKTQILRGVETITYHNNSPNPLEYLWVQLNQNIWSKNSPALENNESDILHVGLTEGFLNQFMTEHFDGCFNI